MILDMVKKCYPIMVKDYRIFKMIFIIWGFYLVFDSFYIYLVIRPTYTSYEKRYMNAEDFPDVIICPEPSIDFDAVRLKGYFGSRPYFGGRSDSHDKSLTQIGWAGNKSEDVKKVSMEVSTLKSEENCPLGVFWLRDNTTFRQAAFKLKRVLYPHHICCRFVPQSQYESTPIKSMNLFVSNHSHLNEVFNFTQADEQKRSHIHSFQVYLTDPLTTTILDQNKVVMMGDRIVSSNQGYMRYGVQIMEEDRLEGVPKYPCINYKKDAYSKCLEKELVRQTFQFLNCTPPWMTENEDLWCKEKIKFESASSKLKFKNLLAGIIDSNYDNGECFEPCRVKRYIAKEMVLKETKNVRGVMLKFSKEISITKSSWKTTWSTLISKTGGFIGINKNFLWIVTLSISSMAVFVHNVHIRRNQHVVQETGHHL